MSQSAVAHSYATALLEIIVKDTDLDQVVQDLFEIQKVLFEDKSVREFVLSPIVKKDIKQNAIAKALSGQAREEVASFMGILIQKDLLEFFPEITEVFSTLVEKRRGRSKVSIVSKEELPEAALARIKKVIEKKFKTEAIIHNTISDDVIGGFLIRIEDFLIDATMKNKLKSISESLLSHKITAGVLYEN